MRPASLPRRHLPRISKHAPVVELDITTPSEGVNPGSNPGWGTISKELVPCFILYGKTWLEAFLVRNQKGVVTVGMERRFIGQMVLAEERLAYVGGQGARTEPYLLKALGSRLRK